ncbi:hypothetical protein [Motilimonas sp. KMU-193]|uniref:hypothetical protein n=1 Tax=Motilimonas sp. KMU-193 TaxID=3388668 RepID=UPI00396AF953
MIKCSISFLLMVLSLLLVAILSLNNINTPSADKPANEFTLNPEADEVTLDTTSFEHYWPLPQVGLSGNEYQNNHVFFKPIKGQAFGVTQSLRLLTQKSDRLAFYSGQAHHFSLEIDLPQQQLFLNHWQYRPRSDLLFSYLCQPEQSNCVGIKSVQKNRSHLYNRHPDQNFAFFDQDASYQDDEPWLFDVGISGDIVVAASQRRIKVFSIKDGTQPVAHAELPEHLQHYRIKALKVSSGAFHIAALYATADGRDSFIQIFEFERYRNRITAKLKITPKANSEFHSLALGNNVLAIGEVVFTTPLVQDEGTQVKVDKAQSQIRVFKRKPRDRSKPRKVKRTATGYERVPEPLIYQHLGTIKGEIIQQPINYLAKLPMASIKHDIAPPQLSFIDNLQLPGKENFLLTGHQLTLHQGLVAQRHYADLTLFNIQTQPISIAERFRSYFVSQANQAVYFDYKLDLSNDGIEAFWTSYQDDNGAITAPKHLKFDSLETQHEDSFFQSDFNHEAVKREHSKQAQSSRRQSINDRIESVQTMTPAQALAFKQKLLKLAEQQGQGQQ